MSIFAQTITGMPHTEIILLENDQLRLQVLPELGGKILSLFNISLQKEFLWTDPGQPLQRPESGADYDSNFIGGIDELLPNDIPETVDGIHYPDHGELWTTALKVLSITDTDIRLEGSLPLSGLKYCKTIRLEQGSPFVAIDYKISNASDSARHFLWKLHAALRLEEGDRIVSSARYGQVVDPAYSRFPQQEVSFKWPLVDAVDVSIVPAKTDAMDFFYLFDTATGEMKLENNQDHTCFAYLYDTAIFPYQWLFASYGGFLGHYTAILEPCTNMPIGLNDAIARKQSALLQPGQSIETTVKIFAGLTLNYPST